MYSSIFSLINMLDLLQDEGAGVIGWGAPVPSFGSLRNSRIATLGLNPSNREFVDEKGKELSGNARRFYTLSSLGLNSWKDADTRHLLLINNSCENYFQNNPYNTWFKVLDFIISGTGTSFYDQLSPACHMDLIPFATEKKWTELDKLQRTWLLLRTSKIFAEMIRESEVDLIILNGKTVVDEFQKTSQIQLSKQDMQNWCLPRQNSRDIMGIAYCAITNTLSGIDLGRKMLILGYNHNLQSSFGVTKMVVGNIQNWITKEYGEFINDYQRN